jgi:hypothetical protein
MSISTFTRYECDWCRTQLEVSHSTPSATISERPREWASAQLEEDRYDLCASCAEALRELAASRARAVVTSSGMNSLYPGN